MNAFKKQQLRYFIELSYNGKNYHGWQIQPDANSVQEEINKVLSKILQEDISIVGAGRTDAGVHASQMFAHFDSAKNLDDVYLYKFNSLLPDDIVLHKIFNVEDDVHARFDAEKRSYEYKIWLGRNPFLLDTTWQLYKTDLDIVAMNKAANLLLAYTDFECFSKVKTDVSNFNCTITHAEWKLNGKELVFYISANRFLRNMVRAIVGTLLEVGKGKMNNKDFQNVIESKNRSEAGISVPAKGLFLTEVTYNFK